MGGLPTGEEGSRSYGHMLKWYSYYLGSKVFFANVGQPALFLNSPTHAIYIGFEGDFFRFDLFGLVTMPF